MTPSIASGILSHAQLDDGGGRKKRKGLHGVCLNQVDHDHLFRVLEHFREKSTMLQKAVWQKNCEIRLKNRAIKHLQTGHQDQMDRNTELQLDVGQLESKILKLETKTLKLAMSKTHGHSCTDMFLPTDNDHLHVNCRLFDERKRAREVEKPFDIRPHLLPGFQNMKSMDGFNESAN